MKYFTVGMNAAPLYDTNGYLENERDMITTASEDGEPCVFPTIREAEADIIDLMDDLDFANMDISLVWYPVPTSSVSVGTIRRECGL